MTSWERYPELKPYVGSVERLFGSIDCDPIVLGEYYMENGWPKVKTIFLNLYGEHSLATQGLWFEKILHEKKGGSFQEAIVLCDAATGEKWFRKAFNYPVCFVVGQIEVGRYSSFVYMGDYPGCFITEFRKYGVVI